MSKQTIKVGDRVRVAEKSQLYEVVAICFPFAWILSESKQDDIPITVRLHALVVVDKFPVGSLVTQVGDKMRIRYEVVQKYIHDDGVKYSIVVDSCGPVLLNDDDLELYDA